MAVCLRRAFPVVNIREHIMKKLLSLPPNLVSCFHELEHADRDTWFCTSDPVGAKLGSGGGTTWLLKACREEWGAPDEDFSAWLGREKRILLHAGGQSRRLPSYAPAGKVLTPVPVFRWARGQRLNQNLLSLQIPLYERIMEKAPDSLHTLIASGDVYIRAGKLQEIPDVDVVCYGLWADPSLAKNHGVFVSSRKTPERLDFMLQKPSVEQLAGLMQTHLFLMDIGIWLLSDRAVELLMKRSMKGENVCYYDLYSDFGCSLGEHPVMEDEELKSLSVAILPLQDGEFYHYGTSREMISSTVSVQNRVNDQRAIMHLRAKPHPAMFVQNADMQVKLTADNAETWVENSCVARGWTLESKHIITGVPANDWTLHLTAGTCLDVVPVNKTAYVLRPYGFEDAFRGALSDETTCYLGRPVGEWLRVRGLSPDDIEGKEDLQSARLFPVTESMEDMLVMLRWMTEEHALELGRVLWMQSEKYSADEISAYANLCRLQEQRERFRASNWQELVENSSRSVFYQVNLKQAAQDFVSYRLPLPPEPEESADLMKRIHYNMFRSQVEKLRGEVWEADERKAFSLLQDGLTSLTLSQKQHPRLNVYSDQIVWSRSPVRIDVAGGWTDTPPYCLQKGGSVVNLAVELNGQPPLQAYVKTCAEPYIVLRSIDLGAMEVIRTYEELADFAKVGSPFSIPKAALALSGFHPSFSQEIYDSLEQQLKHFGCGVELTLFSAVPAGSGLGTSSILAATVLGALSDFCGLHWDKTEICNRTLVLEQLLTTGGGWQDQYGGVLHGVKWLQTRPGFGQTPDVRWMPDTLFTEPEYAACHLLYYTGITRTAKQILSEIVRGMFLNSTEHLELLDAMKEQAADLYESVIRNDFSQLGKLVRTTWKQNQQLDAGTNPPAVSRICRLVEPYCLGYKLPGAGGGGFMYMIAESPEAAVRIKEILQRNAPNERARFVEMSLSRTGLKISRS
ncbi:MAG: bifunctional fucokinase/L-fucose-1-P-guanylyltransferase [Paraprevotella sp.]|nr:bifunctional fucokinase/L-fucose-1-P-guanylyltransferase [Paraprevotella sp.]